MLQKFQFLDYLNGRELREIFCLESFLQGTFVPSSWFFYVASAKYGVAHAVIIKPESRFRM